MDAIGTVTDIATLTLTILGVLLAVLAIWGVGMIIKAARDSAKQIANSRFDDYIKSEVFRALVKERVDKAIKANWQNEFMKKIEEAVRGEDDPDPFPKKDEAE